MELRDIIDVDMPDVNYTNETKEKVRFTYNPIRDKQYESYRERVLSRRIP